MPYIRLFLRLSIYCISLHSCQCHGGVLTSSIFGLKVSVFYWYQSGLLVDCYNAY